MSPSNSAGLAKRQIDEEIARRQVLTWACIATLRASPLQTTLDAADYQFV